MHTLVCRRGPVAAIVVTSLIVGACAQRDAVPTMPVTSPRPSVGTLSRGGAAYDTVPNSYIVVLRDDSTPSAAFTNRITDEMLAKFGGTLAYRYDVAIHGFAVDNMSSVVAARLARHPAVKYVEPNMYAQRATTEISPGAGLDRIDQRNLPLNTAFTYTYKGLGVNVYILDTGIDPNQSEFVGRTGNGMTCVGGSPYTDVNGHGSAVASVAAGTIVGVAKGALLHSVRISTNGTTTTAAQTCGINWVASFAVKPAVANMSYSGIPSAFAVRDAINNVTGQGIVFVKAAGNAATDAFQDRGNRAPNELVVGAMIPTNNAFASFSNYGSTVTISAPGVGILALDIHAGGFFSVDGTSFAAPYVTGVVATMLQLYPTSSQSFLRGTLLGNATLGVMTGLPSGTPNTLLYSNFL